MTELLKQRWLDKLIFAQFRVAGWNLKIMIYSPGSAPTPPLPHLNSGLSGINDVGVNETIWQEAGASLQRTCLWPRNLALDKLRGKEDMVERVRVEGQQYTGNKDLADNSGKESTRKEWRAPHNWQMMKRRTYGMRKGGHGEDRYKSQSNIFRKIDSSKLCKLRISTGPKNQ